MSETILEFLLMIAPFVGTFLLGLVIKSPVYNTAKQALKLLSKALEDDKLSSDELKELIDLFKKKNG